MPISFTNILFLDHPLFPEFHSSSRDNLDAHTKKKYQVLSMSLSTTARAWITGKAISEVETIWSCTATHYAVILSDIFYDTLPDRIWPSNSFWPSENHNRLRDRRRKGPDLAWSCAGVFEGNKYQKFEGKKEMKSQCIIYVITYIITVFRRAQQVGW